MNQIFINACKKGNLKQAEKIYNNKLDKNTIDNAFYYACENGKMIILKWLYKLEDNPNITDNYFYAACDNGYLEIAKWLYSLEYKPTIDIINSVFIYACYKGNLEVAKWLYSLENKPDIYYNNNELFIDINILQYYDIAKWLYEIDNQLKNFNFLIACNKGNLKVAQSLYLLEDKPDIYIYNNAFKLACKLGKLSVAKWLYTICDKANIDLYDIFINACVYRQLEIIKWLYLLENKPDIRQNNDYVFKYICEKGYRDIAEWLASICDNYYIEINYDIIKGYIRDSLEELYKYKNYEKIIDKLKIEKKEYELDSENNCGICFDNNYNFITSCKHYFCIECFMLWYIGHDKKDCAYCRQNIIIDKCFIKKV